MSMAWDHLGEIANVAQLTGLDAVRLIGMIVNAATTARMHKKNCKQFAMHLRLIGNLLQQLEISELKKYPETREPLEQLEDALRRSYILVNSCQDRSYLYLLVMGWTVVYQFRKAQDEIDRYLKIIPLITLVDNARVKERLEYIEMDQYEYKLDDEDIKARELIINPSNPDAAVFRRSLSYSYPDLPFDEVMKKENEKLHLELHNSQTYLDVGQSELIQNLMEIAQVFASNSQCENDMPYYPYISSNNEHDDTNHPQRQQSNAHSASRSASSASSTQDLLSSRRSHQREDWHSGLLGCCSEPVMCLKTFFFPCGTFSKIATVATNRHMTSGDACNELMAYSLIASCCCYTCCIRRKLRNVFNIRGGWCNDFLLHFCCCCCALVQELREIEVRAVHGPQKTKKNPPSSQYMESYNNPP